MSESSSPPSAAPKAAQRVLEAADALFQARGSRSVGVDEIVAVAQTTKPSLYRAFGSKDGLIAAWLEAGAARTWSRIEAAAAAHSDDPAVQLLAAFDVASMQDDDRGCGLSNAAVEYPEPAHAGRRVVVAHKSRVRKRLREIAKAMDARKPRKLADSLMLLIEGAFICRQIFGADGPTDAARSAAETLIAAHTRPAPQV